MIDNTSIIIFDLEIEKPVFFFHFFCRDIFNLFLRLQVPGLRTQLQKLTYIYPRALHPTSHQLQFKTLFSFGAEGEGPRRRREGMVDVM